MLYHFKSIAVFLDETEASSRLGACAASIAQRQKSHLIGIYGMTSAAGEQSLHTYARGPDAISSMIDHQKSVNEKKVLAAGWHFSDLSRQFDISSEFRVTWIDQQHKDVFLHSLHCDLVIVGHPKPHGMPESWTADRLLRETGMPTLIVPDSASDKTVGERVLVAWNTKREARRAITDAMPFITSAKEVTVLVIDASSDKYHFGEEPGADVALMLARHGARVTVAQVESDGESVGETILAQSVKRNADLIVLGARSRARSTEILFGGVTRTLLAKSDLPMLMSR